MYPARTTLLKLLPQRTTIAHKRSPVADKSLFYTKTQMEPKVKKLRFPDLSHDEIRDLIEGKELGKYTKGYQKCCNTFCNLYKGFSRRITDEKPGETMEVGVNWFSFFLLCLSHITKHFLCLIPRETVSFVLYGTRHYVHSCNTFSSYPVWKTQNTTKMKWYSFLRFNLYFKD